jgi:hypothetical protein
VETDRIIASRLYEVVMDRVLIAHEAQYIDEVIAKKLQSVAISRYRIFKQWGEATDIYGLGILVLYVFFLRGFFISRVRSRSTPSQPLLDRSRRDSIFQSIVALLRNPSFVKAFLATLRGTQFDTKEKLWRTEVVQAGSMEASATPDDSGENTPYSRVIKIVEDFMFGMDNNLKYILYGVNSNYGLFMLTIHFSLSCMWRTSELSETDLEPYCQSRLKIGNTQLRGQPAFRAKEDLVLLQNLIIRGIENYNEAIPKYVDIDDRPPGDHDSLTVNLDLIDENQRLKSEKRLLEDKVKQLEEVYYNQRFELNREKQNIQNLNHTNVEKLESLKNEEISIYAARVKELQQQIAALQKPKSLFSRFSSGG